MKISVEIIVLIIVISLSSAYGAQNEVNQNSEDDALKRDEKWTGRQFFFLNKIFTNKFSC